MLITELTEDIALIVPMLILVEGIVGVVAWFAYGSKGGRGARIAAWLGLVTLTLWCGSAIAFVVLYLLLFTLGKEAVVVGRRPDHRVHAGDAVRMGGRHPAPRPRGHARPAGRHRPAADPRRPSRAERRALR